MPRLACLFVLCLTSAGASIPASTPPRESIPLTTWEFVEDGETNTTGFQPPVTAEWKQVAVPHVFRQSGLRDNAAGWYRQTITLTETDRDKQVYLALEGAASVKDVFVNGQFIGRHKGAFSASAFDLTPALKIGPSNTLAVRVSNRDNESSNCFSRSTLYYVNGGMFRKAWLVKTGPVHIFPDMGSSGVYLTPANITADSADLNAATVVRNPLASPAGWWSAILSPPPAARLARNSRRNKPFPPGKRSRSRRREKSRIPCCGTSGNPISTRCARKSTPAGGSATP